MHKQLLVALVLGLVCATALAIPLKHAEPKEAGKKHAGPKEAEKKHAEPNAEPKAEPKVEPKPEPKEAETEDAEAVADDASEEASSGDDDGSGKKDDVPDADAAAATKDAADGGDKRSVGKSHAGKSHKRGTSHKRGGGGEGGGWGGGGEDEEEEHDHHQHEGGHHHHEHEHEHGEHEHHHGHHHHGHHHGFVHEWGQEEGGEHHEHEGEHDHEHHHEGECEHEHHHEHEDHRHHDDHHNCGCECDATGGGFAGMGKKKKRCVMGNKRCMKKCKEQKKKPGATVGVARATDPNAVAKRNNIDQAEKKQTVHVGYGYASGDNYRLGYNHGGMGGIAESFNGKVQPIGDDVIVRKSQVAAERRGMNMGGSFGGMATPYGHPVTHPGFTTMGFPGHAMAEATIEVKTNVPQYPYLQKGRLPLRQIQKRDVAMDNEFVYHQGAPAAYHFPSYTNYGAFYPEYYNGQK